MAFDSLLKTSSTYSYIIELLTLAFDQRSGMISSRNESNEARSNTHRLELPKAAVAGIEPRFQLVAIVLHGCTTRF